MSFPQFNSGYFGTASIVGGATPANVAITRWEVNPTAKTVEYENSGSGSEVVRSFTFKDFTVDLDVDYDFNNDIYGVVDAAITNPNQGTSPKLFVGCQLTDVRLWLNCTAKGAPTGGLLWTFASLGVTDMPQTLVVSGKVIVKIKCKGFGVNGVSSTVNAWGVQTVTPP